MNIFNQKCTEIYLEWKEGKPVFFGSLFVLFLSRMIWPAAALIFLIIARLYLVEAYHIPSASMWPTLQKGDHILVNKISFLFRELKAKELCVFKNPVEPDSDYIKRVIGLGGDKIEIIDGEVWVNDNFIEECYVKEKTGGHFGPIKVPPNHYFVLGDNRNNSEDSRSWGYVPEENIIGTAFLICWPLHRLTSL